MQPNERELLTLPLALLLAAATIPVAKRIGQRLRITAPPAARSTDEERISAFGGAAIVGAIIVALAFSRDLTVWLGIGAGALFLVGVIDDAIVLRPRQKLVCQILVAGWAALFALPQYPLSPWPLLNLCITIFWLVATTNAFNLVDGLDGLSAGIGIAAAAAIAAVGYAQGSTLVTVQALALIGALAGYLFYNFPPASIIMGDAGALPLGYLLGVLSLEGGAVAANTRLTIWVFPALVMMVPLLDTAIVTVTRLATGNAVSRRGLDHAHDRLLSLGLTDLRASASMWAVAAVSSVCAVAANLIPHAQVVAAIPFLALAVAVIALFMIDLTFDANPPGVAHSYVQGIARSILSLGYKRRFAEVTMDIALISAAYFGAHLLRLDFQLQSNVVESIFYSLPWVMLVTYPAFVIAGIYRGIWRYAGLSDGIRFAFGAFLAGIFVLCASRVLPIALSGSILLLYMMLLFNLLTASRMSFQVLRKLIGWLATVNERVLVAGASEAGTAAANFISKSRANSARLIGFVDADGFKHGKLVHGVQVLGGLDDIERIRAHVPFTEILVADDKLSARDLERFYRFGRTHGIAVRRFSISLHDLEDSASPEVQGADAAGVLPISEPRPI
jgi:UDP-GlcNAc:undecaprenyl-phosphate/decaprenyl-phosphate GlcNAc-1-phosphate transferase